MSDNFDSMVDEAAMNAETSKQNSEASGATSNADVASNSEKSLEEKQLDLERERIALEERRVALEEKQLAQQNAATSDDFDFGDHMKEVGVGAFDSVLTSPIDKIEEELGEHAAQKVKTKWAEHKERVAAREELKPENAFKEVQENNNKVADDFLSKLEDNQQGDDQPPTLFNISSATLLLFS